MSPKYSTIVRVKTMRVDSGEYVEVFQEVAKFVYQCDAASFVEKVYPTTIVKMIRDDVVIYEGMGNS